MRKAFSLCIVRHDEEARRHAEGPLRLAESLKQLS
jgi:hypothetical protein